MCRPAAERPARLCDEGGLSEMATIGAYDAESFRRVHKTPVRITVEALFYGNDVEKVRDLKEAYDLAKAIPGTVELMGMPLYRPELEEVSPGHFVACHRVGRKQRAGKP